MSIRRKGKKEEKEGEDVVQKDDEDVEKKKEDEELRTDHDEGEYEGDEGKKEDYDEKGDKDEDEEMDEEDEKEEGDDDEAHQSMISSPSFSCPSLSHTLLLSDASIEKKKHTCPHQINFQSCMYEYIHTYIPSFFLFNHPSREKKQKNCDGIPASSIPLNLFPCRKEIVGQ